MRVTVPLLMLLAVAAGAVWWWVSRIGPVAPPVPLGAGHAPAVVSDHAAAGTARGLPDGVVATRTAVAAPDPGELAPQPTACLRVIDHESGAPLAGVVVRLVANGADVSFTDERGLAPVPLPKPAQLAIVTDDYLLRLVPTQLGSTEAEPQEVRLVRDTWSVRRRLVFVAEGGAADIDEVLVRLHPLGDAGKVVLPGDDPVQKRAWTEHAMLAGREVSRDVTVQLGRYDELRVHRLGANAEVRFLATGDYEIEAATASGLVGRGRVHVAAGPPPPPVSIGMVPGATLRGRVLSTAGVGLAGAEVSLQGGDPLGLMATCDDEGAFELAPLWPEPVTLLVRAAGHRARDTGPVQVPAVDVQVRLEPLDRALLRGRVRARPGLEPIAGATIVWNAGSEHVSRATSGADGSFELPVAGDTAARLVVQANDFVSYAELVEPAATFAEYDLWPAQTMTRLAAGVTGTLEGVVIGPAGPVAGVSLRWQPDRPTQVPVVPGRRTLEGAVLPLPPATTTGADGSFVLETDQFGPGRLVIVGDESSTQQATVAAGRATTGLRFQR